MPARRRTTLARGVRSPDDDAKAHPRRLEATDMPSFGIVSLINRMIVSLLAGLGSAAVEWLPPVDGIEGESWAA